MKPSERIEKIRQDLNAIDQFQTPRAFIVEAIIRYLDEEYETRQRIQRAEIEAMIRHSEMKDLFYKHGLE